MVLRFLRRSSGLVLLGVLPLLTCAAPTCSDLTLTVTAHAQSREIKLPRLSLVNPNLLNDIINHIAGSVGHLWPIIPVGGTYDIVATYCEPEVQIPGRANTIQLLTHGVTYNRQYWLGNRMPEQMAKRDSWVDYASKEGYATISYDRLGSGQSFRADPSLEVQFNLQAEIAHEIAKLLRNGVVGGKQFSKVVYIGHSLGSMVGTIATQRHTDDFDAVVLTGWSSTVVEGFVKIAVGLPIPAALVNPVKWGDLHPGYLAFTGQDIQRKNFYGPEGSFDPAVENHDWENRDTAALGEFLTTFEGMTLSPYVKPVQVIIGEFDYLLCPSGKCANGSTNVPGNARSVFPNSSNFTTFIVPGTGHSLNLHYSAVETFRVAHDFLQYNIE